MRFKLDENLDVRLAPLVEEGGHDVDTIRSEDLSGSTDDVVYETCIRAGRVLITLDLDFSNPVRFPPAATPGIIVVRPHRAILPQIRATLVATLPALKTRTLAGKLWIIEPGRIRVYDPEEGETDAR